MGIAKSHTIDNKKELIELLSSLAADMNYVFRGYSIQGQLLPSLIRNNAVDIESELLYEFEKYANHYVKAANPIDFMSYAQHFGMSTRLIDFTFNPFIALYFSMFKDKAKNATDPEDRIYYYVRYASLDENICLQEFPQRLATNALRGEYVTPFPMGLDGAKSTNCDRWSTWIQDFFKSKNPEPALLESRNVIGLSGTDSEQREKLLNKPILFFDPNQSNQRLIMQQGLFMYPYTLDTQEHSLIITQNTGLIKIHKDLRKEMQSYLDKIGINAYRLMPDLSSVCEAVERQVKAKRKENSLLFKKRADVLCVH